LIVDINSYKIKSDNYCSNWLSLSKFRKLALRLISLKAFK
jgi:hypothetical protein